MKIKQELVFLHNEFQDSKVTHSIAIQVEFRLAAKGQYLIDQGNEEGCFFVIIIKSNRQRIPVKSSAEKVAELDKSSSSSPSHPTRKASESE